MTATPNELARKRPANAVTSRNTPQNVIDGEFRPTRSVGFEAFKGVVFLILILLFAGGTAASLGYL